jgi:hypothetical protein
MARQRRGGTALPDRKHRYRDLADTRQLYAQRCRERFSGTRCKATANTTICFKKDRERGEADENGAIFL